jgi:hypothetical protein
MVAKTKCPGCGEPVSHDRERGRAARRRTYCSRRCRRRAERTRAWNARTAIAAPRAIISRSEGAGTAGGRKAPSNPLKLLAGNSGKGSSPSFWQHAEPSKHASYRMRLAADASLTLVDAGVDCLALDAILRLRGARPVGRGRILSLSRRDRDWSQPRTSTPLSDENAQQD